MSIEWGKVAPVIVSIIIIIVVAFLRNYSKTLAAILATMPINIPLALWVIDSGGDMTQDSMAVFTSNMFWNMLPTLMFIVVVLLCVKSSWTLLPSIIAGYVGWGVSLAGMTLLRGWMGF